MKRLLNKIIFEKKKKIKNLDKIKQLEILLVRLKCADNPNKLENALKELNKIQVVNKILNEIKQKVLIDYGGEFEKFGNLKVGDQIHQTDIRLELFLIMKLISILSMKVMTQKIVFSMVIKYKINTPQFSLVIRSQYGNGCDFKHEIIAYRGNNCFIPTKVYCFVKCINFITGEDYKQQYLDFIRNAKKTIKLYDQSS